MPEGSEVRKCPKDQKSEGTRVASESEGVRVVPEGELKVAPEEDEGDGSARGGARWPPRPGGRGPRLRRLRGRGRRPLPDTSVRARPTSRRSGRPGSAQRPSVPHRWAPTCLGSAPQSVVT